MDKKSGYAVIYMIRSMFTLIVGLPVEDIFWWF